MFTLSIDPGLRGCGVSLFNKKQLIKAVYVKSTEQVKRGPEAWLAMAQAILDSLPGVKVTHLVVEVPQVYNQAYWKGDPADLIELAGVDGAITVAVGATNNYGFLPREWKGQVPKDIHNKRVEAKLSVEELATIESTATVRHNVVDAVGLGLWFLGRR